jgi:hypothetical protein
MAEENLQTVAACETATCEPCEPCCEEESGSIATKLVGDVKDLIAKSGPDVRDRVVQHLVKKSLEERADLILKGLDKRKSLLAEKQKAKPDIKSRGPDGKLEERFSEAKWKEKSDLEEKLKKLDKALEEALGDKANYELLKKSV